MNDTAGIRARIHESAIGRVTRMFAATLADIFAETLQNARRAGATRVRVALDGYPENGPVTVTISDDGDGIADAAVLLSFGENGWNEDLVRREDAAGMGFLSLARRGCAVSSRSRVRSGDPEAGWRVELRPEHFLGEAEATVNADDAAPFPHGTALAFDATPNESPMAIRTALESAARHYPLPVFFEHPPNTPPGGQALPRRAFLDGAVHVEHWRGLVFGVFPDRVRRRGFNEPDVNFHGLTVKVRLPEVGTVHGGTWHAAADVQDCPELEFVLPARKEAVETPFLAEMRDAARLAIYRALAADPDPRPAFEDWKRAKASGIEIEPPPRELRPWRPDIADVDDWREPPKLESVGPDALILAVDPEPPEAQSVWRAAERNGIARRLYVSDRRLEGYAWCDAIPRIADIRTDVTAEGRTRPLEDFAPPGPTCEPSEAPPERPEAIRFRLFVRPNEGPENVIDLPGDVAFAGEAWSCAYDALPMVTPDSDLDPRELAGLIRAAFFCPSDDSDADSWERQRADFEQEALLVATRLLVSDDEARKTTIADAVARDLFWLIPHDRGVDIAVRNRKVTVTLGEPAASEPGREG